MTKSHFLALLIVTLSCFNLYSQSNSEKEALQLYEEGRYNDAERLFRESIALTDSDDYNTLWRLNWGLSGALLFQGKREESIASYLDCKRLALLSGNHNHLVETNGALMKFLNFKQEIDSVEVLLKESLAKPITDSVIQAITLSKYGNLFYNKLKLDSAALFYSRSIELLMKIQDSSNIVMPMASYSNVLSAQNKPDSALATLLLAESFLRPKIDDHKKSFIFERIMQAFMDINNITLAKEYALKELEVTEIHNQPARQGNALLYLGIIADVENQWETAKLYYSKADSIKQSINDVLGIRKVTLARVNSYLKNEKEPLAKDIDYLEQQYSLIENNNQKIQAELILLRSNAQNLSYSEFLNEYQNIQERIPKKDHPKLKELSLSCLLTVQREKKMYEEAFQTYSALQKAKESKAQLITRNTIYNLEAKYKNKEKAKEIEFLDAQNQTQEKLLHSKNKLLWLAAIGIILVSILTLFLVRNRKLILSQKEEIKVSLKEKETLLKEIHHRVKNNLQVVSSLLRLQTRTTDDQETKNALLEGQNRVRSMSLIHQNLYSKDNLSGIKMKDYLEDLGQKLVDAYSTNEFVELELDIEDLNLDVDLVAPLGLIINELITNSLKYAFPDKKQGVITITLKEEPTHLFIEVSDNGIGIPNVEEVLNSKTFGFGLIKSFARSLDAEFNVESRDGTSVTFFIKDYKTDSEG